MTNRKSNFELLRIIAMLLIILGHSSSHGVFHFGESGSLLAWSLGSGINKCFSSLLLPGGAVGVGLFFMITGYFQIKRDKYSITRLLSEVLFYSLLISLIYVVTFIFSGPLEGVSFLDFFYNHFLKTIFNPLSGGSWWYVSVYLIVMLTSPMLNALLVSFSKKGFSVFLIFFLIVWYGISYLTGGSYIQLERGLFFYSLGAFLRLYGKNTFKSVSGIKCIIIFALTWISGGIAYYLYGSFQISSALTGNALRLATDMLDLYVFVIVTPVCSFTLFKFFKDLNLGTLPLVNFVASTCFGIYLFHDANIIRPFIWNTLFKFDSKLYMSVLYPVLAIICSLLIFIICASVDFIRIKFFEKPINTVIIKAKKKAEDVLFRS